MKKSACAVLLAILILASIGLIIAAKRSPQKNAIPDSPDTISIGGISALTGVGVSIGEEEKRGAELAVKEINARGGVSGHKIRLISEDLSLDKIKNAVSVARKLIDADKVVAIIGPQWDEPAMPMLPIIEAAQVPTVGANNTPDLERVKNYEYFFSTWHDNRVGVRELLRFAQKSNLKRVAIIKPLAAGFWEYTAEAFKKEAPSYGVTVVSEEDAGNPLLTDFRTIISKTMQHSPDAIFIVTSDYNQCSFLKQAKELGYAGPTLGTESSGDPTSLTTCPELMKDRYFSTPTQTKGYPRFAEGYRAEFGEYPRYPSAATAYDAAYVIANGLERSKLRGGKALRDAIAATKSLSGASSDKIEFNAAGFIRTPENGFEIQTVRDGKFMKID
ncbi:MAG: hypothetical protein JWO73_464 [Candidatus Taylorbacteria bacterium]|nr:hypothetical protein [Candidatus Taylorbacteria bacterium]